MRAFRLPALVGRVQPPRGGAGAGGVDIVLRRRRRDWKHDPLRRPLYYKPVTAQERTNPAQSRPGAPWCGGPSGASALSALVGRLRPPGGGATAAAAPVSIRAGAIAAAADRAPVSGADFAALLPDVARRLLGDPPRATAAGRTR